APRRGLCIDPAPLRSRRGARSQRRRCRRDRDGGARRPRRRERLDALLVQLLEPAAGRRDQALEIAAQRAVQPRVSLAAASCAANAAASSAWGSPSTRADLSLAFSGLPVPASIVPWRFFSIFCTTSNSKPGSLASSWQLPQIWRITHESHLSPSDRMVP